MTNKLKFFVLLCLLVLSVPSISSAAVTHRVKKHETLTLISQKYHVSVKQLKAANNLVGSAVTTGDLLVIPSRKERVALNAEDGSYTVRRGDRLSTIARKNGISVSSLKKWNGISGDTNIVPGQTLRVKNGAIKQNHQKAAMQLKRSDLFNEKEYEQTLAELVDVAPETDVELLKDLELKTGKFQELKKNAYSFLGTRYRFGGETRRGIDCSSFVQKVFGGLDVNLPRTAREQYLIGDDVPPEKLQKGDLIFFRTYARFPSHVGIYLGENKMIHASSASKKVVISDIRTPYYRARYIGAKRIGSVNPEFARLDELVVDVDMETETDLANAVDVTLVGEDGISDP